MAGVKLAIELPEEMLALLAESPLASLTPDRRLRVAVAVHLFVSHQVSLGRAAELSGEARIAFEDLLLALNIPLYVYGEEEFAQDKAAVDKILKARGT